MEHKVGTKQCTVVVIVVLYHHHYYNQGGEHTHEDHALQAASGTTGRWLKLQRPETGAAARIAMRL